MRNTLFVLATSAALAACSGSSTLVSQELVDSLMLRVHQAEQPARTKADLDFWKARAEKDSSDFISAGKYGQALLSSFHLAGSIRDLLRADSVFTSLYRKMEDADVRLQLSGIRMLRHRFDEARLLVGEVEARKEEPYAAAMMAFDADLELGRFGQASLELRRHQAPQDFAYLFRHARQEHQQGNADSAISCLLRAAALVPGNAGLRSTALSNAADLNLHEGRLEKARELFLQSLQESPADLHSLGGLAWIAARHDENETLAGKIYHFIDERTEAPDAQFRLAQITSDSVAARSYAESFVREASRPEYGPMYNKYLIMIYTGLLQQPRLALQLARDEARQRPTPQTAAWLSWCLHTAGQKEEAYRIFREQVSGRPLEAQELFWMGMMMKSLDKQYEAGKYFEAALHNQYDLGVHDRRLLKANFK